MAVEFLSLLTGLNGKKLQYLGIAFLFSPTGVVAHSPAIGEMCGYIYAWISDVAYFFLWSNYTLRVSTRMTADIR